jgi:hypothetical protein
MSRSGLTSTNRTASIAAVVYPRFFAEFDFSGGFVRVWSGIGNITTLSKTFAGIGTLGGFDSVTEADDVSARGLTFSLSGVPSSLVASALGENYRGRACAMWVGFCDAAGALVDTPLEVYSGFMERIVIEDSGETSVLAIETENHLSELRRPRISRFSNEEQQRLFPGDVGLEFVAKLWERPIIWGVANKRSESTNSPAITARGTSDLIE